MKTLGLILLLSVALVGCGGADDDYEACHTWYSYSQNINFGDGVTLVAPSGMYITAGQVDEYYQQTLDCMGVSSISGPQVQFLSFHGAGLGGGAGLYTSADGGRVYINTDEDFAELDCNRNRTDLKHEYVHHILNALDVAWSDNASHNSPYFGQCAI